MAMMPKRSIFFSVGEPSGDLHAARLIGELQRLDPNLAVRGFGGPRMLAAGTDLDFELTNLAVIGFTEVLPKLREFFRVADLASDIFDRERPDAVVLVDFPGFNWHIAKRAKKLGIPVLYYLPPQLWAWGQWRLRKLKRNVDQVLCCLPFEHAWYTSRGVNAECVGHPFFDEVAEHQLDPKFMRRWTAEEGKLQVAVLPGSRDREVENIWPIQLAVIRQLAARHPGTRFHLACLRDRHCRWCRQQLTPADEQLNLQFFVGRTSEILQVADCALIKSGSVSLEVMARETPAVVIYHASRMLYTIGKSLVSVPYISLPNLMADREVMPEFIAVGSHQQKSIEAATAAMDHLMSEPTARQAKREELRQLSQHFGQTGATANAAASILRFLSNHAATSPLHQCLPEAEKQIVRRAA
jgi:lipid-A-disaccharide synthase